MQAFFDGSDFVNRDEFKNFSDIIIQLHPEVQALNYLRYIPLDQRTAYEQSLHKSGFKQARIKAISATNSLISTPDKSFYYPIHYTEPFENNKKSYF